MHSSSDIIKFTSYSEVNDGMENSLSHFVQNNRML